MNIWIINHNAIPPSLGSQTRHYYFSKYLTQKGHNIKIITASMIHNSTVNMIHGKEPYVEKIVDDIPYTFVKTRSYRGNGLDRIYNLIEFPLKIWLVYKKFELPNIIYTSSPNILAACSALLLSKKNNIKCIVEVRDLWPESIVEYTNMASNHPIIKLLYLLEKWMYKNADALIFTMPGGKDYISEKYGKLCESNYANKIFNINNGVDIDEFNYNKIHYRLKDDDLLSTNTFKVIYTGSIRKVNNLKKLIDCARLLLNYDDIIFLIYGKGNELESLKKYAQERQIYNVKFKGYVEKKYIPFILSQSSLNVVNVKDSNINRFGCSWNKLYEYFASGKPVLSNLKVKYDLINQYNCGISRSIPDDLEYMKSIKYFYDLDVNTYNSFCKNAEKAAQLFDYKYLSNELEEILKNINN